MPSIPAKVVKGQPITASAWNGLIDYVRSMTPQPGSNVRITTGASGTSWSATQTRGGRGGKKPLHPFQVLAGNDDAGAFCTVVPGVVGIVSPYMSGERLDATEPPKLYIGTFPLWLQVWTKLSTVVNDYRIIVDKDALIIFQDGAPHEELKMTWGEGGYTSGAGQFFVKIAGITVTPEGESGHAIEVKQLLSNHIRSFVITADRVLVIS